MRILVFGAGKSGTTALFYGLKKQLPGYELVFEPPDLSFVNYECANLLVKSLNVCLWQAEKTHFQKFDRKILLVRHPFDRLISFLLYAPHNGLGFSSDHNTTAYINLLKEKVKDPSKVSVLEVGTLYTKITGHNFLKEFQEQHQQILELCSSKEFFDFQLLKYENLIDKKLENIENYMGVSLREPVKVSQSHERVVRKKGHSDWKNWFTKDDIESFSKSFIDFMREFQYSTSSTASEVTPIDPLFSYRYTISIINAYRKANDLPEYEEGALRIQEEGVDIDAALKLLSTGELTSAKASIERAIKINPVLPGAYFIKARVLLSQNHFPEALLTIEDGFKCNSES